MGYTNSKNSAVMMRLLYRQCEAFDGMHDKLKLTKLFTDAFCGPDRMKKTSPDGSRKWWWTSRTILGRTGSMTTFLQDPNQYRITNDWKSIIIFDCPKKWWDYAPTPIIFAIIDAAFAFYICSYLNSAALHQDDGRAAALVSSGTFIRSASVFAIRRHRNSVIPSAWHCSMQPEI